MTFSKSQRQNKAMAAVTAVTATGLCLASGQAFITGGSPAPTTLQTKTSQVSAQSTTPVGPRTGSPALSASAVSAGTMALAASAALLGRSRKKLEQKKTTNLVLNATSTDSETECINAIRFLAVDAVNKSNSGHPGAPMGQAPIGYLLFAETMNYNPQDPQWVNRDRFVLSSGHGCMLQYSLLHLAGYKSVSMDDIKQFRQWGSKTPGHPENFETEGIEVTTGPLGMGISNAVGLAAAEAHLAAVYNKPGLTLIDHYTYTIAGDGCMQEGISHESCAYAGHLGLGKLIAFYDDNGITIDGHTDLSFTEDVGKRFEAYGWQVLTVKDGDTDVAAIRKAIADAKACTDKPTLIKVKTTIGFGSPNKADSHDAHGAPLGAEEAKATRQQLGWNYGEFEVPQSAYDVFRKHAAAGTAKQGEWDKVWAEYQKKEPELAAQFKRSVIDRKLPDGWDSALPKLSEADKGKATRLHSQDCLNAIANVLPEFIGGSADLAPSNMTLMKCTGDFLKGSYSERNMRFGIREFGMGAVANAISLDKTGLIPYCATFTIFSDYMRGAIRIAALSQAGTIFVTTHDSVAVGEDGPTHQPIETIPSLRLIPDLTVIRPADGNETAGAYKYAVERSKLHSRPTFLAFSRQALPNLPNSSIENTLKGAYAVVDCADPELILIGTGSEVSLCVDAAKQLAGKKVKVVSMPSCEIFRSQVASYKDALLPKNVPKLSVEAAVTAGWSEWADAFVGVDCFGASAPGNTCLEKFGFNVPNVVSCAERALKGERGVLSNGSQAKH
jgi:transketolase